MAQILGIPFGDSNSLSSGAKIDDAVIVARPCVLKGVNIWGDGSNAVEVILYDNASAASGTVVYHSYSAATAGRVDVLPDVVCRNGLYLNIVTPAGTAGCLVYVV